MLDRFLSRSVFIGTTPGKLPKPKFLCVRIFLDLPWKAFLIKQLSPDRLTYCRRKNHKCLSQAPWSLEKKDLLMKTKHYKNGKVAPSGHLAAFLYGFQLIIDVGLSAHSIVLSKYESPIPEPTQGGDTSRQHDLNPDTTKHGLVTKYWLFLVAVPQILWRSLNDYDDKDLLFCCDTINKHFPLNSIYLLTVSILYFPVCLSVSRQISKFGDDHITHFT